jgi:hypothetical protein
MNAWYVGFAQLNNAGTSAKKMEKMLQERMEI